MEFEGHLWTGRIYNFKKIAEMFPDTIQVCVMRWKPRYINLEKEGIQHMLSFSPSIKLMQWHKKEKQNEKLDESVEVWQEFLKRFYNEFKGNQSAKEDTFKIRRALQQGESIVLLCHEKAGENCHRRMLPYLILTEGEEGTYKGEMTFGATTIQNKLDWW